jgi:hypothetical protein
MTIAMTPAGLPAGNVSWRALDAGLWVARRDGRHLGSVQPGRRWLATDAEGEPIGTFRSFREAQVAVGDPASHRAPVRRSGGVGPAAAVAVLGATALVSAAGWIWTAFLL